MNDQFNVSRPCPDQASTGRLTDNSAQHLNSSPGQAIINTHFIPIVRQMHPNVYQATSTSIQNYGFSNSVPSNVTMQPVGMVAGSNNGQQLNGNRFPESTNYAIGSNHSNTFSDQTIYRAPMSYNVITPKMHPNKTSTMQYMPQTVLYYPQNVAPPMMQQHAIRPCQDPPTIVRSQSMNIANTEIKRDQVADGDYFPGILTFAKSENQQFVSCNSSATKVSQSEEYVTPQNSAASSSTSIVSSGSSNEDQISKGSSKSSPSPEEWASDFDMDLSQLPAFNFNLEEICEDVLFPEQDDFDDILIDDLALSPKSTPPGPLSTEPNLSPLSIKSETNKPRTCNATQISGNQRLQEPLTGNNGQHVNFSPSRGMDQTNFAILKTDSQQFCSSTMPFGSNSGCTLVKTEQPSAASSLTVAPSGQVMGSLRDDRVTSSTDQSPILSSTGNVRRRRRPDRPSNVKEACSICGDKASGYHYNALSCEGCKGFFRRSVTNDRKYTCEKSGACNIDIYMRRKCQKCRLERCYAAGMRKECLMSVEQCRSMQAKRKTKSASHSGASVVGSSSSSHPQHNLDGGGAGGRGMGIPTGLSMFAMHNPTPNSSQIPTTVDRGAGLQPHPLFTTSQDSIGGYAATGTGGMQKLPSSASAGDVPVFKLPPLYDCEAELTRCGLSGSEVELVLKLVRDRWSVGMPGPEKTNLLPPWPGRTGDPGLTCLPQERQRQMKFQHMTHLTRICMESVIQLAKRLHNFSLLDQQHQIRLVKPACIEVLMINSAQYFDVATDRLLMATGHWTTHEQMEDGLLKYGFGTQMWQFARQLALMSLHDIEFALLTAICILSPDRNGLSNECQQQVMKSQEPYLHALQLFCQLNSVPNANRMQDLLSKLVGLRSISFQHRKYLFGIQLNKSNWEPLPQLLGEIFDHNSNTSDNGTNPNELKKETSTNEQKVNSEEVKPT